MFRPISDLFRHRGTIYVYCSDMSVKRLFARHLIEQGFVFGDGASPAGRGIDQLMCVRRDFTIGFCGIVCQMQCGSLEQPEYVREDSYQGCTRVDYARFISGEEDYVIRGRRPAAQGEAAIEFW